MEKKLRRKLDITKVRKQQKSVKLVNALVWLGPSKITRFTCMPQCHSVVISPIFPHFLNFP